MKRRIDPTIKAMSRWLPALLGILLVGLCAGCATCPSSRAGQSSRAIPAVAANPDRPDQALVAAFFAANGIRLSPEQIAEIVPAAAPEGCLDRHALRRIAGKYNRHVTILRADENYRWDRLANQPPLLVLLPTDERYRPAATPLMPVAWDAQNRTLDLLDGRGEIQTVTQDSFFGRREPLKHAALCLTKPDGQFSSPIPREQKLLLADFWFDASAYRRQTAVYTAIQPVAAIGETDVGALLDRGTDLIRKGRYPEAIPVFQAALALDPENPKILNNLAFSMLKGHGELMIALRLATKAAQLEPENPLVLETLGSINLHIGDAPTAAHYLQQAWARALRRSPEVQIAIMDQLVRAQLASNRHDLALQVAEYRHRTYPNYRFPKDILSNLPSLRRARLVSEQNIMREGG